MGRLDLTRRLVARLTRQEAVIGGIGNTNFDLWGAGHRPQNFYMIGSMGLAVPIALGVALAQPGRGVVALEGDGSVLMQLGCLTTVAHRQPANLLVVILDNGAYEITGGQPTATALGADIVAIAQASGLRQANWAADEADFEALVQRALTEPGPWLIGARIALHKPQLQTERDPAQIRDRFMRGIGTKAPAP